MSALNIILLLIVQLWLLAALILVFHQMSRRYGPGLITILLGTLTAALHTPLFGSLRLELGGSELVIFQGSFILFPVILMGLLIIYIINGTQQARILAVGLLFVTILMGVFSLPQSYQSSWYGGFLLVERVGGLRFPVQVSSAFSLALDLVIMAISYQFVSNLRNRHPSRTAATMALLIAVVCDALIFPLLLYASLPTLSSLLWIHLAGKCLAIIALWPFIFLYLGYYAPGFPNSAAALPRPVLEIFSNSQRLEARARLHYSLLRTVSQINQIIIHTNDARAMLDEICQLLVNQRDYSFIWIGLLDTQPEQTSPQIRPAAQAGKSYAYQQVFQDEQDAAWQGAFERLMESGQVEFFKGLHPRSDLPSRALRKAREQSAAAFPMRHDRHTLGVLFVYAGPTTIHESEEKDFLENLADDVAHALFNLDARQQQSILQTAAETMQDGLFITDLNRRILYANPAIANLMGCAVQELEGKELQEVFAAEDNIRTIDFQFSKLLDDQKTEFDLLQYHTDGQISHFAIRATLTHNALDLPAFVVLNLYDTTRSRQYESRLLTLNRFATEFVQEHEIDAILTRLFPAGEEILQADASSLLLHYPGKEGFSRTHDSNLPGRVNLDGELPPGSQSHFHQALFVSTSHSDGAPSGLVEWLRAHGLHGVLFLSILFQEQYIGTLLAYYQRDQVLRAEDLQLGLTLAHTLAIAIQNARLYQSEHSQRRFAEALAQGAAALNSSLDLNLVLDQILEQTMRVVECRSINLMLIEEDTARVVRFIDRLGSEGMKKARVQSGLPLKLPTLQQMIAKRKPLIIPDTTQSQIWSQLDQSSWIASYAGAPLQVQGQTIGFLNLNSDQTDFFSEEISARLQAFADTSAAAIQNARLYEESRMRADELSILLQAANVVSTSLDINQVLDVVAEQMTKALNIRGCAISDFDPFNNSVQLRAKYGPESWWQDPFSYQPFKLDQYPVTYQVLQTRTPIALNIDDPQLDAAEREYMQSSDIKTVLMLPLYTQDRTLGLVELIDDVEIHTFSQREIDLVKALGAQAAIAIENASLYQKAQNYATELEERVIDRTAELSAAKERIERILVSVPDAIIVLDDKNYLVQANPAGESLLVLADQEGVDLFSSDFLNSLTASDKPSEQKLLEIGGRYYQALASALPGRGFSTGLVIVLRDVTRFRELDQMKNQFVSDVSHELRTPLTNLSLYLDMLSNSRDDFNNQKYLTILHRETDRLTYLIEDLLTISRLEASKLQVKIESIDVNRLVMDLMEDRTQMAHSRQLKLTCIPAPDLPSAQADPRLLTQVLSNLLTNALNYTPAQRAIQVYTGLECQNGSTWVTVSVSDTGLGIPEEELKHLFTRFFRGSASRSSAAPGTGLGLAISKEIMERLNGRITVESQFGQGTTFCVWLPAVL